MERDQIKAEDKMQSKDNEEILSFLKEWQNIIEKVHLTPKIIMDESGRIASAKTQINERGSIKDRLAQTDEEAEVIARAEDLRSGRPLEKAQDSLDDAMLDRIFDDMVNKTILKGM